MMIIENMRKLANVYDNGGFYNERLSIYYYKIKEYALTHGDKRIMKSIMHKNIAYLRITTNSNYPGIHGEMDYIKKFDQAVINDYIGSLSRRNDINKIKDVYRILIFYSTVPISYIAYINQKQKEIDYHWDRIINETKLEIARKLMNKKPIKPKRKFAT